MIMQKFTRPGNMLAICDTTCLTGTVQIYQGKTGSDNTTEDTTGDNVGNGTAASGMGNSRSADIGMVGGVVGGA